MSDVAVIAIEGSPASTPDVTPNPIRTWTTLDSLLLADPLPFDRRETLLRAEWWSNPDGHPADRLWTPFRASALRRFLEHNDFDFAIIEDVTLWRYGNIVEDHCPVVIDYHNVQAALEDEYLASIPHNDIDARSQREVAATAMRKVQGHAKKHLAITCSARDRRLLIEAGFSSGRVAVVHNTLDLPSEEIDGLRAGVHRSGSSQDGEQYPPVVLFTGVMNYPPNIMAANDLMAQILPMVRQQIPQVQLWIVGMSPTYDTLDAARGCPGVTVISQVVDTKVYFRRAAALSVPLTVGGGTRFKILEAFRHGLPVVSSAKGCEGLEVTNGEHLLVASSPSDHASHLVSLIRNTEKGAVLAKNAGRLLVDRYTTKTALDQWRQCVHLWATELHSANRNGRSSMG